MVHLHKPRLEDLWFREMMISDLRSVTAPADAKPGDVVYSVVYGDSEVRMVVIAL